MEMNIEGTESIMKSAARSQLFKMKTRQIMNE